MSRSVEYCAMAASRLRNPKFESWQKQASYEENKYYYQVVFIWLVQYVIRVTSNCNPAMWGHQVGVVKWYQWNIPEPASLQRVHLLCKLDFNRPTSDTLTHQYFFLPVAIKMCYFDLFQICLQFISSEWKGHVDWTNWLSDRADDVKRIHCAILPLYSTTTTSKLITSLNMCVRQIKT